VLKKLLILLPLLVGVAVVAYMVAGRQPPERRPAQELTRAVRVINLEPVSLVPRVIAYGSVEPGTAWRAIAQVGGEIAYVHPDLNNGALLAAGTEIVRISPADYDLAVRQAEANIRSARARLDEIEVSETNTSDLLAIEKRGLELREAELARKQDLFERGTLALSALELEQRETLNQRKKVQDLENALRLLPTQRAVQREQLAVYQEQLASARLNLERTSIKLPFDGRIADVTAEQQQFVQTGTTLATADSIDVAEVRAEVPLGQFRAMIGSGAAQTLSSGISPRSIAGIVDTLNLDATVRLRTGGDTVEWPARFARIAEAVDPATRTLGAFVAVDNPYAQAVPGIRPPLVRGMFVEVEIRSRPLNKSIVVPRSALHDGKLYIVGEDRRLEIRPVQTALVQGTLAAIRGGVSAGETIVVSDLVPAIPGMLLDPQEDELAQAALSAEAEGRADRQ
jgi:RND family efflux transporter MFP subunit